MSNQQSTVPSEALVRRSYVHIVYSSGAVGLAGNAYNRFRQRMAKAGLDTAEVVAGALIGGIIDGELMTIDQFRHFCKRANAELESEGVAALSYILLHDFKERRLKPALTIDHDQRVLVVLIPHL